MAKSINARKLLAIILLSAFVLVSLLSASFIIAHADHDCTGKHCAACAQIHSASCILKLLFTAVLTAPLLTGRSFQTSVPVLSKGLGSFTASPVSLKVRMNH